MRILAVVIEHGVSLSGCSTAVQLTQAASSLAQYSQTIRQIRICTWRSIS
jgi:uncharacterized protein YceK